MTSFKNRHVWIIGAGSGIGRALAAVLAADGAMLTLSSRNTAALNDLNAGLGGRHTVIPLDVTDETALHSAAAAQPRIDALIFLAGQYEPGSVMEATADKTRRLFETNVFGAFNAVRAVLPVMHRQGGGQIALCGSIAGYRGLPMGQPYSATKAALISLAESLRAEQASHHVDIRLISSGFVDTPMTRKNTFHMPMMITPAQAARAIADGLRGHDFEIHFPKRMTWPMKLLRILPDALYFKIAGRL